MTVIAEDNSRSAEWKARTQIWTEAHNMSLIDYLATHDLGVGKGTVKKTCSLGAINLAQTGVLTDMVPECMSVVIGRWIIRVQDRMPSKILNSEEWKQLLPRAAVTGRDKSAESRRIDLLLDWLWTEPMTRVEPCAAGLDVGDEWQTMTRIRDIRRDETPRLYKAYQSLSDRGQVNELLGRLVYKAYRATRGRILNQVRADLIGDATHLAAKVPVWSDELEAWATYDPGNLLQRLIEA